MNFTCPNCKHNRLEEIMTDVTVVSNITAIIFEDGELSFEYGEQSNEDGKVDRYQCMGCGYAPSDLTTCLSSTKPLASVSLPDEPDY